MLRFLLFLFVALPLGIWAQDTIYIQVDTINILGLENTRRQTVLMEIPFSQGDVILDTDLADLLSEAKNRLLNTFIFSSAEVVVTDWTPDNHISIEVNLEEAWAIYPIPLFELADRNFNVWWVENERDWRRVNYGLNTIHSNLTGRADRLSLLLQSGYTQKLEIEYKAPYLFDNINWGYSFNVLYTRNKEVNYSTVDNEQQFERDSSIYLLKRRRVGAGLTYRANLYMQHGLNVEYHQNEVRPQIRENFNPDFFLGTDLQRYLSVEYNFKWDKRDERPYPMDGHLFHAQLRKEGLGIWKTHNALDLKIDFRYFLRLGKKFSISPSMYIQQSLIQRKKGFYNYKALGYNNHYVRGYEYYVVDGMDAYLGRFDLRYEFLNKVINWGGWMPLKPSD